MVAALVIAGVIVVLFGLTYQLYWRRRYGQEVSAVERENEANANFRPSARSSDPGCPRCHARGVSGFPPRTCPLCQGQRHVRFGPEPESG